MNLKTVRQKCPTTVLACNKRFCVPLLVRPYVLTFHHCSFVLRLQSPTLELLNRLVKLLGRLGHRPPQLLGQLALFNFPLFLASLDVDLETMCAVFSTT